MKRAMLISVAGVLVVLLIGLVPVLSQEKEPAEEVKEEVKEEAESVDPQKFLASLVGDFETVVRIWAEPGGDPVEAKSRSNRKLILGDMYLRETYELKDGPYPHIGEITLCYSARTQKMQFIQLFSAGAHMRVLEGDWDAKGKTLEFKFSDSMVWEGETLSFNSRYLYTFESADSHKLEILTAYLDAEGNPGPEIKETEVAYTRVKK